MNRRRAATLGLAALVLVAVVAGVALGGLMAWRALTRTPLESAVRLLPEDTLRASWTDWAGVRREVGASVDRGSSGVDVEEFVNEAFAADLTGNSAFPSSAATMQESLGFSPATLDWELFSQARDGAAVIMHLPSLDGIADRLRDVGFTAPESDSGVWDGGPDVVAAIPGTLTPELQYVALLEDDGLVVTSDDRDYLEHAVAAVAGDGPRLSTPDVLADAGSPLTGVLFAGDFVCEALAMSQADAEEQAVAGSLVTEAGGVSPLTGYFVSRSAGDAVRVAMSFEEDDQAESDAVARARLARGRAAGQGQDYPDLFTVETAASDGNLVLLDLKAQPGSYTLSALTTGPVLLATC